MNALKSTTRTLGIIAAVLIAIATPASAESYQPLREPLDGFDAIEFVQYTVLADVAARNDWDVSAGTILIGDRTFRGVVQYCGPVHTGAGRIALVCIERRGEGFYAFGSDLELPAGSWRNIKVKLALPTI